MAESAGLGCADAFGAAGAVPCVACATRMGAGAAGALAEGAVSAAG